MATAAEFAARAKQAVMTYNVKDAKAVAEETVAAGVDIVEVINDGYTAGITAVGDLFDQKKIFLPHMMAASGAMTAGMDVLTPALEAQGGSVGEGLGTMVVCTIEGDIHSIGKDILAIMLKVAGFNVVNIGRDVALMKIVEACKENKAMAVGTSALMTSTMVGQKTLEELFVKEGIKESLITNVGGAPVTQQWADEIGADVYSESATDAVAKMTAVVKDSN